MKAEKGVKSDTELTAEDLQTLIALFKEVYFKDQGSEFPQDPKVQLIEAVKAVFQKLGQPQQPLYIVV